MQLNSVPSGSAIHLEVNILGDLVEQDIEMVSYSGLETLKLWLQVLGQV
jgi:hypothetical protein